MFKNVGKTIKVLAKINLILGIVVSFALLLAELDEPWYLLGSLEMLIIAMIASSVIGLVSSLLLYGFGELVDCTKDIRDRQCTTGSKNISSID